METSFKQFELSTIFLVQQAEVAFSWYKVNAQKQLSRGVPEKGILKNFTKFTGKYLCQNLFVNKVACRRPETSFKKRVTKVCLCEFLIFWCFQGVQNGSIGHK